MARMERARARAVRRRALGVLKWAAVVAAAWAVSAALCGRAAGGLSRFDAGVIFVSLVVLWALLESLARDIAGAAREWMRVRTRERVLEMRARRTLLPLRGTSPEGEAALPALRATSSPAQEPPLRGGWPSKRACGRSPEGEAKGGEML